MRVNLEGDRGSARFSLLVLAVSYIHTTHYTHTHNQEGEDWDFDPQASDSDRKTIGPSSPCYVSEARYTAHNSSNWDA